MKDRFGVTFPIYNKVDVNGAGAHPLFAALKKYEPELSNHNPKLSWNFTVS
jgi:glutathione peroxidase